VLIDSFVQAPSHAEPQAIFEVAGHDFIKLGRDKVVAVQDLQIFGLAREIQATVEISKWAKVLRMRMY